MKNFLFALVISIVIHFILLINFKSINISEDHPKSVKNTVYKYTHIKLVNIRQPKKIKKVEEIKKFKKVIKKIEARKKVKYKKVQKKHIKPAIRQKPKKIKSVFTSKKELKKPLEKHEVPQVIEPTIKPKKVIEEKPTIDLAKEYQELLQLDTLTKSYIKLYGNEYFNLSHTQRKYLKENLNLIGRITQQYLRYPSIAIRTRQSGTNIVEFILKPNGDIANLKITGSSSYSSLDRNTIKTIKIAYKDYPRPKENTKVKIFVKYIFY